MSPAAHRLVVTGGFGALGQAVVRRAQATGARVGVIDLGPAPEGAAAGTASWTGVDLSDPAQAERTMAAAAEALGGLDALVNVAGGFRWQTFADADLGAWDRLFDVNLKTAASATKAALPYLLQSAAGRIVNVGAAGAQRAGAGMGPYAASKAAVAKLTESLAAELVDTNVTVNAVLPSIIDTPANRGDMPAADPTRWVAPDDLAAVILFLAGPDSRAMTGALVPVLGKTLA